MLTRLLARLFGHIFVTRELKPWPGMEKPEHTGADWYQDNDSNY